MGESKKVLTGCALCYHNCGTEVTVEDGRVVKVEGLKSHPLNNGKLCPRAEATIEHIYHPNRLKYPLKRTANGFERISWDQALTEIAAKLTEISDKYGSTRLGFFCGSMGVENLEMVSLTHRFQAVVKSPNYFSVESICYRMRIRTRQITFGKYPVEELDSKLYVLWGHNPTESDYPLSLAINENLKKGSKVIVIDPRKIPFTESAEMYLGIRPGTDGALALAMINVVINEKLYDAEFVEKWTHGFDKLVPHIQQYTPEWAEKITWVPAEDIRKVARMFATTKGAAIYQGTCTQDQQASGTQTDRALAILQTITGNINVPGGWVISPRLKLGDITLPVEGTPMGGEEYPIFHELWGRKSPYALITMLPERVPSEVRSMIVVGGNPLVTMPDSNALKDAFSRMDLVVVHDMVMTETAEMAHYVLPAAGHLEDWGLAYNYNVCHCLPYLMIRKKAVEPYYESRSALKMYKGIAEKMGLGDQFPWESEEDLVAYELAPSGLPFDVLLNKKPAGEYYQPRAYEMREGMFSTPSKKIEIYSDTMEIMGNDPLPTYTEPEKGPLGSRWAELGGKYPLILSTGTRSIFYTNSQFRHIESLREKYPDPFADIGPETAKRYGVANGDFIIIENDRGWVKMKAKVTDRTVEGVVVVPHGWWRDGNCNLLTDCNCREKDMGYPQWKGILCSIRKA